MTGLQRVLGALQGHERLEWAVSMNLSLYGAKLAGNDTRTHYSDPIAFADGQSAVADHFGADILFAPFALAIEGEIFGSQLHYAANYAPVLAVPAYKSVAELLAKPPPEVDSHPRIAYLRRSLREIAKRHGSDSAVAAIGLSPADIPAMIFGVERWLEIVLFEPEAAKTVVDYLTPYFLSRVAAAQADGAHFLVLPTLMIATPIMTRPLVERLLLPWLNPIFAQVGLPLVIHHTGAPFNSLVDLAAKLPKVVAVVVDSSDKLDKARSLIGPDTLLMGGIDGPSLNHRSAAAISKFTQRMREERASDRHFMLISTAADVPWDTDQSLIKTWFEVARA